MSAHADGVPLGSQADAEELKAEPRFSSLFPSHLYLKTNSAGQEIEHNEELHDKKIETATRPPGAL